MSKFKVSFATLKIILPLVVVLLGVFVAVFPFNNTSAFFTSALAAISNPVQAGDWTPPEAPLFWVEEDQTQVRVEWLAVTDAVEYKVYRSDDNVTFTAVATVTAPTIVFDDTGVSNDTEYFYKVTAVDAATNETDIASIGGKRAFTKDIVIDDTSQAPDFQSSGTVSSTGTWDAYSAQMSGYAGSVLQNAVGGDDYSTGASAADQTYTWETASELDGSYDVFVQYICDSNRGIARYDVKAGGTTLNGSPIEIYQSRTDGLAASAPCGAQASTSVAGSTWVKLGTFGFSGVNGSVMLTAPAGQAYILADAVAFHRTGDYVPTSLSLGFETSETEADAPRPTDVEVEPYGYCPVITKDSSQNGNTASVQKLKWTEVPGAVKYRLDGFVWNGSSWTQAYNNFDIAVGDSALSVSGGVVTYTSYATNEGKYAYMVEAIGSVDQVLGASPAVTNDTTCTFTVDRTPPQSTISVTDGDTYDIDNRVVNGGFEADLNGWTKVGDVEVVTGSENGAAPKDTKMVRIGDKSSGSAPVGNSVDVNILSQTIPHLSSGTGVKTVGFWYNFMTYEDTPGFDEPGFMVFVGDKMVHQVWASDIPGFDGSSGTLNQTGWRFLSIDVSELNNPTLSLAFYSGNTGDLTRQSFVYVDNVTTNEVAVNPGAQFTITATDNVAVDKVYYEYKTGPGGATTVSGQGSSGLSFSLTEQPYNGVIEYWASDTAGNVEARNNFQALFDENAPAAISDLNVTDDNNGNFTLKWTAPSDVNPYGVDQAGEYDVRYSTNPISTSLSEIEWAALPKPAVYTTDGQPGGSLRAPLQAGRAEVYAVHVDNGPAEYFFAVRAKDRAGNISPLVAGSIDSAGAPTASTVTRQAGDVVINEIMWMGSDGDTTDEWIELRNMTDKEIDVSGWVIENAGPGSTAYTLPATTTLPASNFIVISRQSAVASQLRNVPTITDAALDLDDSGEQLTLKTSAAGIVIDQTATGVWAAGENTTTKRSMERDNVPSDGTNSHNWHTCDSASCEDARELYWDSVGTNYGTPGAANLSFENDQVETTLTVTPVDADHLTFAVENISAYTMLNYTVEYVHQVDGANVTDALTGSQPLDAGTRQFVSDSLYLGTCSSNGETCVSHAPATDVRVTVVLQGPEMEDRTLTQGVPALP